MGLFSRRRSRTEEAAVSADDDADPEDDEVTAVAVAGDDAAGDAADDAADDDARPAGSTVGLAKARPPAEDAAAPGEQADGPGAASDGDAGPEADGEDEAGGEEDEGEPTGQVEFELADWGARERQLLDGELAAARVRRAWEASTLVVRASDADVVDDLIDYIEERIALDLSPDVEPVIYEVTDWPQGLEDRFLDVLIDARIPHARGYREITVGIDDEERVDDLVEQVTEAWEDEQPTEDELDGPDAQDVLSELFVSSDRLLHDPSDRAATVRFDDAAESAQTMSLPFGFDEGAWTEITDLVTALREKLAEADSSDDEIVEAATALRVHLRPLV